MKLNSMSVYIASPFFTPEQLELVKSIEHTLTSLGVEYFSPRLHGKTIKDLPENEREAAAKEAFDLNILGLEKSNVLLYVLNDKDVGSAFECGYWVGTHSPKNSLRPIVAIQTTGKPLNIMIQQVVFGYTTSIHGLASWFIDVDRLGVTQAFFYHRNFGTNLT